MRPYEYRPYDLVRKSDLKSFGERWEEGEVSWGNLMKAKHETAFMDQKDNSTNELFREQLPRNIAA